MSINIHHTTQVKREVLYCIAKYLVSSEAGMMRTLDGNLIRDLFLSRGILSNDPDYKQERDAFLWFLNEDLPDFLTSDRGNASNESKMEFMVRIAVVVIINYLYVHISFYNIHKTNEKNRRGYLVRQMRNAFREFIGNKYLIMNSNGMALNFFYLQRYEQQVINQTREQYGEEVRKMFAKQFFKRERQSIDQRSNVSRPKNIDEAKAYYPEELTCSQTNIESQILPNLHIQTYDKT